MRPCNLLDMHHAHGPNCLADILIGFMQLWSIQCMPHVPQPQSDSAHLPACLRPLKRDLICFFNNIWKTYDTIKAVGHTPCPWAKPLGRYFERFHAIEVNLMHFACPAATLWLCAPASMSLASETRLNMPFNDILKSYEAIKLSDTHHVHGPNRLADILRGFYVILVNSMHFACPISTFWLCAPASICPTIETRLNMLLNDILKSYEALKTT